MAVGLYNLYTPISPDVDNDELWACDQDNLTGCNNHVLIIYCRLYIEKYQRYTRDVISFFYRGGGKILTNFLGGGAKYEKYKIL